MRYLLSLAAICILTSLFYQCSENRAGITEEEFFSIAHTVSEGWNKGDASLAIRYFDENAVYEEPPKKQFYKGRREIFEFFGGEKGPSRQMSMTWHNLSFNEKKQIGFGEYTFSMNNQYHGIVVIQISDGKIIRWREYQYQSALDWKTFAGESEFETEEFTEK
jgi:hypothetical protein